jgi:ketosteroid isomerase-like protein
LRIGAECVRLKAESRLPALVDIVKQHYANVSQGDWQRDREIMSPDVVTMAPGAGTLNGLDAFLGHEAVFPTAFPDARAELIRAVASGDTVIVEGAFSGTRTGPLASPAGEVPPTGRSLRLEFADVFVIRDGIVVEHRIYYDQVEFMTQLGLMPSPVG